MAPRSRLGFAPSSPYCSNSHSAYFASETPLAGFRSVWFQVKGTSASRAVCRRTEVRNRLRHVLRDAAAFLEKIPVMAHRLDLRRVQGLVEQLDDLPKVVFDAEGDAEDLREAIRCHCLAVFPRDDERRCLASSTSGAVRFLRCRLSPPYAGANR
jgi:hypothetical protein